MKNLISLTLGLLLNSVLSALTVEPAAVEEALAKADLVIEGKVSAINHVADQDFYARRLATVDITKVKRGDKQLRSKSIVVESVGGERNGVGVLFNAEPRLYAQREYRLYLNRLANGNYTITGWDKGALPIDGLRTYSRNRVDGSNGEGTGAFLYWDAKMFPIPYFISAPTFKNLPHFIYPIDLSFHEWAKPANVLVEFLPMGCTASTKNENNGINTIVYITQNWPFDPTAIAITRNFYVAGDGAESGKILDSDILLNAVHHSFTVSNETGKHDIQNIVTHEAGHFLGLGHEVNPAADSQATMYSSASANEINKRSLAASDLAGIYAAYKGVGNKYPTSSAPSCTVYESSLSGCLGASQRTGYPPSPLAFTLYWVFLASLGWILPRLAKLLHLNFRFRN